MGPFSYSLFTTSYSPLAGALLAGGLLQQFRTDEQLQPSASERDIVPVVDRKVDDGHAAGRQIFGQYLASGGVAAADQAERQLVQAGIMPDDEQALRILGVGGVDDLQQLRGGGAV